MPPASKRGSLRDTKKSQRRRQRDAFHVRYLHSLDDFIVVPVAHRVTTIGVQTIFHGQYKEPLAFRANLDERAMPEMRLQQKFRRVLRSVDEKTHQHTTFLLLLHRAVFVRCRAQSLLQVGSFVQFMQRSIHKCHRTPRIVCDSFASKRANGFDQVDEAAFATRYANGRSYGDVRTRSARSTNCRQETTVFEVSDRLIVIPKTTGDASRSEPQHQVVRICTDDTDCGLWPRDAGKRDCHPFAKESIVVDDKNFLGRVWVQMKALVDPSVYAPMRYIQYQYARFFVMSHASLAYYVSNESFYFAIGRTVHFFRALRFFFAPQRTPDHQGMECMNHMRLALPHDNFEYVRNLLLTMRKGYISEGHCDILIRCAILKYPGAFSAYEAFIGPFRPLTFHVAREPIDDVTLQLSIIHNSIMEMQQIEDSTR